MGCGRIAAKSELMRLALDGARGQRPRLAVHDRTGTLPGRGAYLCRGSSPELPVAACVTKAVRRNAIARALRCAVTVDPKLVESL